MKWLTLITSLLCTPLAALPVERCVNMGNALDAPSEGLWGYTITTADLDWIAAQGFDTIRLPVRFSQDYTRQIDPALLARTTQVVDLALARGLQVLLDVHHFEALMTDPQRNGPILIAIWQELALHFQGYPPELMFEIINEPTENLTTDGAVALYNQIIPTIRALHPERWIVIGGGDWNSLEQMMRLGDPGPNIALTFHYYSPFEFTHQNAPWHDDPMPARDWGTQAEVRAVQADIAIAGTRDVPVLLGEFGAIAEAKPGDRAMWTGTVRAAAEANDMGWCVWSLTAGFPIFDEEAGEWMPGMEAALMGR